MVLYTNPDQYYWYQYSGPLYFWPILLVAVLWTIVLLTNIIGSGCVWFKGKISENRIVCYQVFYCGEFTFLNPQKNECSICKKKMLLGNAQLIDVYYLLLNFVSNYWYMPYQAYIAISVKCPSITWAKQFQLSNAPLYLCRPLFQQTPAISSIRSTRSLNQVLKPSTRIARKWSTNQLHVWCEIIDLCAISW